VGTRWAGCLVPGDFACRCHGGVHGRRWDDPGEIITDLPYLEREDIAEAALLLVEEPLQQGSLVVIEPAVVRVRSLPVL
jgi:hypothetical protein